MVTYGLEYKIIFVVVGVIGSEYMIAMVGVGMIGLYYKIALVIVGVVEKVSVDDSRIVLSVHLYSFQSMSYSPYSQKILISVIVGVVEKVSVDDSGIVLSIEKNRTKYQ